MSEIPAATVRSRVRVPLRFGDSLAVTAEAVTFDGLADGAEHLAFVFDELDAYALQDAGLDTYAANTALGLPEDARDYTAAAQMLTALGVTAIDLLSNNPDKARQLASLGIAVRRTRPTGVYATPSNLRYLHAKVARTGHTIALPRLAG